MMPTLIYPVPNESPAVWEVFRPFVQRFANTLWGINAGTQFILRPVHTGEWTSHVQDYFRGLIVEPLHYLGAGCDIGAAQFVARHAVMPDDFLVPMTTRTYFHRSGWLLELLNARLRFGPGLYGTSASHQNRSHVCVRQYGVDAGDFVRYPLDVTNRELGQVFECGVYWGKIAPPPGPSLTDWYRSQGKPIKIVRFDGVFDWEQSIGMAEGFREGTQREMLAWDKHSDIFASANPRERHELQHLTKHGANRHQ